MDSLEFALRENRTYLCLSCGKCTAVCPISRLDADFSPRRLVESATVDEADAWLRGEQAWKCLTCMRCSELCPSDVHFSEFVRDARALARADGNAGACTHGDVIHTWMRMMQDPGLKQNRLDWVTDDLQVSDDGDTLYFVGCLPYYDVMFGNPNGPAFEGLEIARNTVRLLNRAGIAPRVLADERCCGHDLLWAGDPDGFRRLAELNLALFADSGVRRIVTACAECYGTLKIDYAALGLRAEVLHISQALAQAMEEGKVKFEQAQTPVTFHDPCRLGRHGGEYDAPRALLQAVGDLREMEHSRQQAVCCGTSVWTQCGQTAKAIQAERLGEAAATGAETLVTSCPKCQIHFHCAMADSGVVDIKIHDLTTILAEALP